MRPQHVVGVLFAARLVDQDQARLARGDGVHQRLAAQAGVDKGRLRAHTPQGKPQPHKDVAVDQVHGDDMVLGHALGRQPCGVPQHRRVRLRIRPGLPAEDEEGVVGAGGLGVGFERIEEVERVGAFGPGAAERAARQRREQVAVIAEAVAGAEVGECRGGGSGDGDD